MGHHLKDGQFQSDKYPTTPPGKVPLSVKDKSAQDLLWQYAQRRRAVDAEFSADLEVALKSAGYDPAFRAPNEVRAKCAKIAKDHGDIGYNDCEYLGFMDPTTGARECSLDARGKDCPCDMVAEVSDEIAAKILAIEIV